MPSLEKLEEIITEHCNDSQPPVFLHPKDVGNRDYTDDELQNVRSRDFQSRLFISNTNIKGQTAALRTRFSDNHAHTSHFNVVRDIIKTFHSTKNFTSAKTHCTELLSKFLQYKPDSQASISKYYTFAVSVASSLSNFGEGTSFEHDIAMVKDSRDEDIARLKLCLLMDIIFSKISMFHFLVYEEGTNSFRVAYCQSKCNRKDKQPFLFAAFSFLLQFCLTAYVVLENVTEGIDEWHVRNLPLAILTLIYGTMIIYPSLRDKEQAFNFYGNKYSLLQQMDFFVNHTLSTILVFSGFVVIMIQQSFIEAVLNSAALLFIPEIDDQLPSLLGFDESAMIENFIIAESLKTFDKIVAMPEEKLTRQYLRTVNKAIGVEFSDYFLTNIREQSSLPSVGQTYQPYQVKKGSDSFGHQIYPSNFVTPDCLVRKLVWSYTLFNVHGSKPRIGRLRIETIKGEIIEIQRKGYEGDTIINSDANHTLEGAFIITSFHMCNDIIRLRVCGSKKAADFTAAFEYYNLWAITPSAKQLLEKEASRQKKAQRRGLAKKGYVESKLSDEDDYVNLC
jgi:hypothetical protein